MKIKINDGEFYELNFPNEVSPVEFLEIYEKFGKIFKLIRLSNQDNKFLDFKNEINSKTKVRNKYNLNPNHQRKEYTFKNPIGTYRRSNHNPFFETRERVLDLLQYAYHGSEEDKNRISRLMGKEWNGISKCFHNLIKIRYNDIKPDEIGLTQIPSQINRTQNIKIPNYVIKSHTGIFDENGNN